MSLRQQWRNHIEKLSELPDDETLEWNPSTKEIEMDVEEDLLKFYMKKIKKAKLRLGLDIMTPNLKKAYLEYMDLAEKTQDFFLITINPKKEFWKGDKFNYFFNLCRKVASYIWVKEIYWFFEQRGETAEEMGKGVHCHFVLTKHKTERARLIKNLNSCFGAVCEEPYVNTINVKNKKYEWLKDTLNDYLIEAKKHQDKLNKVKFDPLWRGENNLQNKYYFEDSVGLTIDERPTTFKGRAGGARMKAGVKPGTKRGKYKKKKTGTTKSKIPTPDRICDWKNENVILEF